MQYNFNVFKALLNAFSDLGAAPKHAWFFIPEKTPESFTSAIHRFIQEKIVASSKFNNHTWRFAFLQSQNQTLQSTCLWDLAKANSIY